MKHTQKLLTQIGAIVISIFVMPTLVQANSEMEPNSPISSAQAFATTSSELNVSGSLTSPGTDAFRRPLHDVDFYSFFAFAGDSIDIGASGDVDTSVALFGLAPGYALVASGDASSRMSGRVITESGIYTVAVANSGAFFSSGGTVDGGAYDQGAYSLSVSGLSMPSLEITIDVKPRRHDVARINLRKKRKVKVAILGEAGFNVANIDQSSLTFGAYGDEKTLRKCKRRLRDVNGDGVPDLVCKFRLRDTGFDADSTDAVLKGRTKGGKQFHGKDRITVKKHERVARRKKK